MNGLILTMALAAAGVEYGWKPHEDGGLEYIIQVEPELLDSLRRGMEITSEIHPQAVHARRFRIRVGSGAVPREGHAAEEGEAQPPPPEKLLAQASERFDRNSSRFYGLNAVQQASADEAQPRRAEEIVIPGTTYEQVPTACAMDRVAADFSHELVGIATTRDGIVSVFAPDVIGIGACIHSGGEGDVPGSAADFIVARPA